MSQDADNQAPHPMEAHRALARELNRLAQRIYSRVGTAALLSAFAPAGVALATGSPLLTPLPWIAGVTLALVVLLVGRRFIRSRISSLRARVDSYCRANDLSMSEWTRYYAQEGTYSFLASVLEDTSNEPMDS